MTLQLLTFMTLQLLDTWADAKNNSEEGKVMKYLLGYCFIISSSGCITVLYHFSF